MKTQSNDRERGHSPWVGKPAIYAGCFLATVFVWLLWPKGSAVNTADIAVVAVQRGPLSIHVLEGGNIHALESHEFRCEIRPTSSNSLGDSKILSIIQEGYEVTPEDVAAGKVLVELDPSKLKERILSQESEYQTDLAQLADADEARAIQASENLSIIKEVRQSVRFAGLDFEKYLGTEAARMILKERKLPYDVETLTAYEEKFALAGKQDEGDETGAAAPGEADTGSLAGSAAGVDFLKYIEGGELGDGTAQQALRVLQDNLLVARNELALAEETFEGSKRLADRGFLSQTSLENEQVALQKSRLRVQSAETELDLFRKYEFPKAAEEYLSNYEESLQKLDRTKRAAAARMAQMEVRYRAAERGFQLELKEKEDLDYQLERCTIRAQVPGLVAYGGAETNYLRSRSYDAVTEGAEVRFGQPIITIPDMSKMGVTVNIHESYVKKVAIGQETRITIDAEPGVVLRGTVTKLAVLPDSANMRYNPNLKVYPASIRIDGSHDWLKPGMSARVEIVVDEIPDTLYVPVQSVFAEESSHYCYVSGHGNVEKRQVIIGDFNDQFVQIKAGLGEGESVFLSEPPGFDSEGPGIESPPEDTSELAGG